MTGTAEGSSGDGEGHESSESSSGESRSPGSTLPFDAVANLRLLGEVQRRGLEAANQVISRLTERTNAARSGDSTTGPQDQMAAMADAFIESVVAAAAAMAPGSDRPSGPPAGGGPAAGRDRSDGKSGDPVAPEVLSSAGRPGESAHAQLWVHNYTDDPAAEIRIHFTELIDACGSRLPNTCVTVRPDQPFDLSAASSRPVQLTVDLPSDAVPGRYRAIVTAANLADLWLVLAVDVLAAAPGAAGPGAAAPGAAGAGSVDPSGTKRVGPPFPAADDSR